MKIIEQCEQWFKDEGYPCTLISPTLLRAKYEGLIILIPDSGNDVSFLKVDVFFGAEQFKGTPRLRILEAVSKVNEALKVVKAYIDKDDDLVLTTEVLLDETPEIGDILPRLLSMLKQAPIKFSEYLNVED